MQESEKHLAAQLAIEALQYLQAHGLLKKGEHPSQFMFDTGLKAICRKRSESKPDIKSDIWQTANQAIQKLVFLEGRSL